MSTIEVLQSLKVACDMGTASVCEATAADEQEILKFISRERPFWLQFIKEHSFKIEIGTFPGKVIILKDKDETIRGMVAGFPLDDLFIISHFLMEKYSRGQFLGSTLIRALLESAGGDRNIAISSSVEMASVYQRRGFKIQACQSLWGGVFRKDKCNLKSTQNDAEITKVRLCDITSVLDYDKNLHPYKRNWFIRKCIFGSSDRLAYMARQSMDVVGYGYINFSPVSAAKCSLVLYADSEKIAGQLLSSLVNELEDSVEISVIVPGSTENSVSEILAGEMGLEKQASNFVMMYLKHPVEYQWQRTFFSDNAFATLT